MHWPLLNFDADLQWLFSPVHIREVFRECAGIFKHEKELYMKEKEMLTTKCPE